MHRLDQARIQKVLSERGGGVVDEGKEDSDNSIRGPSSD